MKKEQEKIVQIAWENRQGDIPLKSSLELIILASIVEREALKNSEKPIIASVFVNRINRKMRLQSDPTVIYALTKGKKSLNRKLTRKDLKKSSVPMSKFNNTDYLPYKRNEKFVREWAIPGMSGLEHRVGGLEKENLTGNVSYDSNNHEFMVKTRAKKVDEIANYIPGQELDAGSKNAKVLVLGWGSTYGAIKTAVKELLNEGYSVAHTHLRYINPFPKNLESLIRKYDKVLIPEINNGQLIKLIRDKYVVDAIPMNKIQGIPFEAREIKNQIIELHDGE